MATIKVCDHCKKAGTLVAAVGTSKLKGAKECNIDYCDAHKSLAPKKAGAYIKFAYELMGFKITESAEVLHDRYIHGQPLFVLRNNQQ